MCLGDLTGVDFPGEKHPKACPCDIARQKERLDQVVGVALVVVQRLVTRREQRGGERRRRGGRRRKRRRRGRSRGELWRTRLRERRGNFTG